MKNKDKKVLPIRLYVNPTNKCNFSCSWCFSKKDMEQKVDNLPANIIAALPDFISSWYKEKSEIPLLCIGGGGEPLIHNGIDALINELVDKNVPTHVTTNGVYIDEHIKALSRCVGVAVSVDAVSDDVLYKTKNSKGIDRIFNGIRKLAEESKYKKSNLYKQGGKKHIRKGLVYKFLISPENYNEVYIAAKKAKDLGCSIFYATPVIPAWFLDSITDEYVFDNKMQAEVLLQIIAAKRIETDFFKIFYYPHFQEKDKKCGPCRELLSTCVIKPAETEGFFDVSLCCFMKGHQDLFLGRNMKTLEEIKKIWLSNKHMNIYKQFNMQRCPTCPVVG